jgi:hypothetical protein
MLQARHGERVVRHIFNLKVYMMKMIKLLTLIVIIFLTGVIYGNTLSFGDLNLKMLEVMTPSEYLNSGLKKLTPVELKNLDKWLNRYTNKIIDVVTKEEPRSITKSHAVPSTKSDGVIESKIEGDFEGWEGETIFKLDNGQIWQQSSYAYTYHYAYRPDVIIYKVGSVYKMKVEGVDSTIYVRRLK